jgi:hypothetical protein
MAATCQFKQVDEAAAVMQGVGFPAARRPWALRWIVGAVGRHGAEEPTGVPLVRNSQTDG